MLDRQTNTFDKLVQVMMDSSQFSVQHLQRHAGEMTIKS